MTHQPNLRALLLQAPGVTDLVSDRVAVQRLPKGVALPALVIHLVSEETCSSLTGVGSLFQVEIQVDAIASSLADAEAAADAVFTVLTSSETHLVNGSTFRSWRPTGRRDDFDEPTNRFRVSRDWLVFYQE